MSENAIGNKSTEFIRKNVGIGNLLGLKNVNIYSFSLNKDTGAVTIEACSRRHSKVPGMWGQQPERPLQLCPQGCRPAHQRPKGHHTPSHTQVPLPASTRGRQKARLQRAA